LTGYEGILGYRTDQLDLPDYAENKEAVLPVIEKMKATGWSFASHGYGHLDAAKVTLDRFKKDTLRWKKEVEPLIGPTSVYIYPFGSSVLPDNPKYQFLVEQGFRLMCSVGPTPYLAFKPDSAMMDRRHIDGIALHDQRSRLLPLFDSKEVWDDVRAVK
jgi:peptidoglycan/xylan/chitin deacetylase (PgdA/CDA1 family)